MIADNECSSGHGVSTVAGVAGRQQLDDQGQTELGTRSGTNAIGSSVPFEGKSSVSADISLC